MNYVEQNLPRWRASLMQNIPVKELLYRNPIAYKWKSTFGCWYLREATIWRVTDLLTQSYALHQQNHGLGSRILLRSSLETLATLIYLNHIMRSLIDGELCFQKFGEKTSVLARGSRDKSTDIPAINILTMLEKSNRRYPGLRQHYDALSESAHPNHEGLLRGYSKIDHVEYIVHFSNRWAELYGDSHLGMMETCMETFLYEYDVEWACLIEKMENWLNVNDADLEATWNTSPSGD